MSVQSLPPSSATWFDGSHINLLFKVLKKNSCALLTIRTREKSAPDYEIAYSKAENMWVIREYVCGELVNIQHKRKMRSWALHVEDVDVLYIQDIATVVGGRPL